MRSLNRIKSQSQRSTLRTLAAACALVFGPGCGSDGGNSGDGGTSGAMTESTGNAEASTTNAGDGDGDASTTNTGDGDASTTNAGDGDGDASTTNAGDGDGDASTTNAGDGDGDASTTNAGDGDGDASTTNAGDGDGDGDGDASTTNAGDGDGDGDGDTSTTNAGDGDGDGDNNSDIQVVITADNAYGFGWGSTDSLFTYYGGLEAFLAGEIFNCGDGPETYVIDPSEADQAQALYIIAWADSAVTQGVLGQFRRSDGGGNFGPVVYTGDPGWQVCATGMNFSPGSGGPSESLINQMIGECNAGTLDPATSSGGWVDQTGTALGALAVGEDNTTPYSGGPQAGNEFPIVCQSLMDPDATWMWFDWDTTTDQSPFLWPGGVNTDHQFLIFRLPANLLPQ